MAARTLIAPTALIRDGSVAQGAGVSIAPLVAAGATIASPGPFKLLLLASNTAGTSQNVILRASRSGVDASGNAQSNAVWNTVFTQATVGDLTVAVAAGASAWILPTTTDRFTQDDGSMSIDFSGGFTGTLWVVQFPYNKV